MNIENDSEKLGEDCFCKIKNWVDLRHVAIRSKSWGPSIVEQVENLEYNLKFYDQKDPVRDDRNIRMHRYDYKNSFFFF